MRGCSYPRMRGRSLGLGTWCHPASVARVGRAAAAGPGSGRARGPHTATPPSPTPTSRCGMEQLHVPKLLAGALAAVSGAVVASFFGIEGTLIGAALASGWMATASTPVIAPPAPPAVPQPPARPTGARGGDVEAAVVGAFGIALGAITGVEAVANQPLA